MTEFCVKTLRGDYPVRIGRGLFALLPDVLPTEGRVLVVSDDGVPAEYVDFACEKLSADRFVFPAGETSKNEKTLNALLSRLAEGGYDRGDTVVALGGGVVSDLAGFAASIYMRGMRFVTVPTTLLAMLDASVGGKVGIDYLGVKNLVGAFYSPACVLIDPSLLSTLPKRDVSAGLVEAVKIGITLDPLTFGILEEGGYPDGDTLDLLIERCVKAKIAVTEADEFDTGARRVLNFGHTFGHALEAAAKGKYRHGECVAIGMIPMCSDEISPRVRAVLDCLDLPNPLEEISVEEALEYLEKDKKKTGNLIRAIFAEEIGGYGTVTVPTEKLKQMIRQRLE